MSIPPPNLNLFAQSFAREIEGVQKSIIAIQKKENPSTKILCQHVQELCSNISIEIKRQGHNPNYLAANWTLLSAQTESAITNALELNTDCFSNENALLLQKVKAVSALLTDFQNVVSHKDEINQHSLEPYLFNNEPWALAQFKALIHSKNPWAEAKLAQYAAEGKPCVLQLVLEEVVDKELIIAYKDTPGFRTGIIDLLDRYNRSQLQQRGYWILQTLLQSAPLEWSQQLIKEVMAKPSSNDSLQCVVKIWKEDSPLKNWLRPALVADFCDCQGWAMNTIYQLLKDCQDGSIKEIINELISHSKGNILLQQRLLCLAAFLPHNNIFRSLLVTQSLCVNYYPNSQSLIDSLGRLERFKKRLEQIDSKYHLLSFLLQYHGCLMILKREQRLIDVLNNNFEPKDYQSPAISDCFPQTEWMLLGTILGPDRRSLHPQLTKFIKDLAAEGINFECPLFYRKTLTEKPSNVLLLPGETGAGIWLRDSCIAHTSGMRIPNFICSPAAEISPWLLKVRESRVKEGCHEKYINQVPFGTIGTFHEPVTQFEMVSYFLGGMSHSDPFHDLCFTYNEGGNCLIGEVNKETYAIIGKDAFALNLQLLREELAALGFRKLSNGKWEKTKPYDALDCNLDEQDLRLLFSLDLGILPKNIHFVENPDYHLDVSMAILNEKTVIVNDSVDAVRVWEEYAKQTISSPSFRYDSKRYQKRLEKLKSRAAFCKQHEDLMAKQLTDQHFNVIRVGGRFANLFEDVPGNYSTNLFNFLTITSLEDRRIVIGMDTEEFFINHFKESILKHIPEVDATYYLNADLSRYLTELSGGVHCLMRPTT